MAALPDFLEEAQVVFHEGGIVFTDEYSFAEDEMGIWQGDHTMYARIGSLMDDLPAKLSAHPVFTSLFMEKATISGSKAGWVRVVGRYVGLLRGDGEEEPDDDDPQVRYTLGISLSDDPLETFNDYVDGLTPVQIQEASEWAKNPPKDDDGEVQQPDTSGWPALQVELFEYLSQGVVSYRVPRPTWTKSWVSTARPANLNVVGKINTPPNAPSASEDRNWLCAGLTSVQLGKVFENEQVWELSGRGGWITKFYS